MNMFPDEHNKSHINRLRRYSKMATKKTAKKQNKKTESNLFDFSSMQDRAERLLENVKTDGEKYARKSFEICKDFADDVRKDPSRVVTDIIDSGKDFVSDIQKDVRKKFNGMVKKGRKTIDEFPTMKTIEKRGIVREKLGRCLHLA